MEAVRLKVNITLWLVAVRRKYAETTNPVHREYLAKMYAELVRRMPE